LSKPKLILIGAGGHACACIDVIEQHGGYEIAGLVSRENEILNHDLGYDVISTDNDLEALSKEYQNAFITIGQIQTPDHRIRLYQLAIEVGFQLPVIIAPSAYVSRHATIGAGTIIMQGAIVNAGSSVGNNCIINTRALVEHNSVVADHCHIATGAILNGDVRVGEGSFVGSGSIIKQGARVGHHCVVGMGLALRHNLADYARFVSKDKA
jgi:sugar O-acyltransferase (sialic acid O-acetyltransferase NeuD family)